MTDCEWVKPDFGAHQRKILAAAVARGVHDGRYVSYDAQDNPKNEFKGTYDAADVLILELALTGEIGPLQLIGVYQNATQLFLRQREEDLRHMGDYAAADAINDLCMLAIPRALHEMTNQ